mgnify:CR=1 FL=1
MKIRLSKEKIAEILNKNYRDEVYGVVEATDFVRDVLKEHEYEVEMEEEEASEE